MTSEKTAKQKETIPLEEAKQAVEMTARRLGLLYLSFARTLVGELGEKQGKELIMKAIKDYGRRIGKEVRESVISQGLDPIPENYGIGKSRDIPKFGMHERKEEVEIDGEKRMRSYGCTMAKLWHECGEDELGRLYCYVDPAKYMAFNPNFKLIHIKALPDGDEYCELAVRPTTEQDRKDFAAKDADWSHIDT
jgi:hypothetical protein